MNFIIRSAVMFQKKSSMICSRSWKRYCFLVLCNNTRDVKVWSDYCENIKPIKSIQHDDVPVNVQKNNLTENTTHVLACTCSLGQQHHHCHQTDRSIRWCTVLYIRNIWGFQIFRCFQCFLFLLWKSYWKILTSTCTVMHACY